MLRTRALPLLLLAGLLLGASNVSADVPAGFSAGLRCMTGKGIALCIVKADATPLSHVTYAQANIVSAPAFLQAIKTQVEYRQESGGLQPEMKLGFRATGKGRGELVVEVKAVVCTDAGTACPHFKRIVATTVSIDK